MTVPAALALAEPGKAHVFGGGGFVEDTARDGDVDGRSADLLRDAGAKGGWSSLTTNRDSAVNLRLNVRFFRRPLGWFLGRDFGALVSPYPIRPSLNLLGGLFKEIAEFIPA